MPELYDDLEPIADAFRWLTKGRSAGFDLGPIPPSEITNYMDRFGVPDGDEEAFMFLIGVLDTEYLKALKEQMPKEPSGNVSPPRS